MTTKRTDVLVTFRAAIDVRLTVEREEGRDPRDLTDAERAQAEVLLDGTQPGWHLYAVHLEAK